MGQFSHLPTTKIFIVSDSTLNMGSVSKAGYHGFEHYINAHFTHTAKEYSVQSAATLKDLVARLKAYADGFRSHMPKLPNGKDTQKAVFVLVWSGNDVFIGKTRNTIAKLTPAMLQTAQDLMNLGDHLPGQLVIIGPGDSN